MYLNVIQIAESFGVSEDVVEGWVREDGLPHTTDRGRLVFDRAEVAEWAATRGLAGRVGFLAPEASVFATGCRLEPLLRAGGIWRGVRASEVMNVLDRVVAALPGATLPVRQMLARRLRASGGVTWAPVGGGFALPHPSARIALGRDSGTVALLLLDDVMPVPGDDEALGAVTRLLFFIAPSPRAHLDLLGRLSRLMNDGPVRDLMARGAGDEEIFAAVAVVDGVMAAGLKPGVNT